MPQKAPQRYPHETFGANSVRPGVRQTVIAADYFIAVPASERSSVGMMNLTAARITEPGSSGAMINFCFGRPRLMLEARSG
jgi:hypothetical protein